MDEQIYIFDSEGKRRPAINKTCDHCGEVYIVAKRFSKKSRFCNKICASNATKDQLVFYCSLCGVEFMRCRSKLNNSKYGLYFCSRLCKEKAQSFNGIPDFKPSSYKNGNYIDYRKLAFDTYGKKCNKCSYSTYERMLDVHHLNNDRSNNKIENLEVLCLWCHGLVTRNVPPHSRND